MAPTKINQNNKKKKKSKRPVPIVPKPVIMKSRKKARKVTTMFHKLTRERDQALQRGDQGKVKECDTLLEEMGGRKEYQRASQLSTSFHSTSKWVLGQLAHRGWLHGIVVDDNTNTTATKTTTTTNETKQSKKQHQQQKRRVTRLLEVGAINTELLDAAEATITTTAAAATTTTTTTNEVINTETLKNSQHVSNPQESSTMMEDPKNKNTNTTTITKKKYKLHVRAIDLHSMDKERIEEADFLTLPYIHSNPEERYDVIVCSMVINCVTNPADRGKMLMRLYHHLRPGGLLFLTLPLFCLTKSAFLTHDLFQKMLGKDNDNNNKNGGGGGVGFEVLETKNSPRLAFFICRRPEKHNEMLGNINPIWKKLVVRNKGKKFPNQFSVILNEADRE